VFSLHQLIRVIILCNSIKIQLSESKNEIYDIFTSYVKVYKHCHLLSIHISEYLIKRNFILKSSQDQNMQYYKNMQ